MTIPFKDSIKNGQLDVAEFGQGILAAARSSDKALRDEAEALVTRINGLTEDETAGEDPTFFATQLNGLLTPMLDKKIWG